MADRLERCGKFHTLFFHRPNEYTFEACDESPMYAQDLTHAVQGFILKCLLAPLVRNKDRIDLNMLSNATTDAQKKTVKIVEDFLMNPTNVKKRTGAAVQCPYHPSFDEPKPFFESHFNLIQEGKYHYIKYYRPFEEEQSYRFEAVQCRHMYAYDLVEGVEGFVLKIKITAMILDTDCITGAMLLDAVKDAREEAEEIVENFLEELFAPTTQTSKAVMKKETTTEDTETTEETTTEDSETTVEKQRPQKKASKKKKKETTTEDTETTEETTTSSS